SRGRGWLDALHPEDRERVVELWSRAMAAPTSVEMEFRLRRPDGSYTWMLSRAAPVLDEQGGVREWVGTLTDISDRREELEARMRLAAIVDSSDDAIVAKTLEGIVTSWNQGAERIFGYRAEEMIGQPISRLMPPERSFEFPSILAAIRRGERLEHFETERICKGGRRIHVSLSVSPVRDPAGKIVGVSKIARDVTEKKEAEARLRKSEELTQRLLGYSQAVLTNMAEGLYTVDTQGRVTFINTAAERLFGWTREELVGRTMHDVTHYQHPDGSPFPAEECAGFQVLRTGGTLRDHEDVFIRKDGSFFPVIYSSAPIRGAGNVEGLAVVFRDVTHEKEARSCRWSS
ncbi:MAG: PAS domain-containing protein, partial [Myxococcota bacterium]